jgi:hypothetical protein
MIGRAQLRDPKSYLLINRKLSSVGVDSALRRSDAFRLHLRHPCTLTNDIFFNKLRQAGRRVLCEIPSRGLNQGKLLCALCFLSRRYEDVSPARLPNNLGGVSPNVCVRTHDRPIMMPQKDTRPMVSGLLRMLASGAEATTIIGCCSK